ncbi:MAG: hypothetical protein WCI04_03685 [archaeon]
MKKILFGIIVLASLFVLFGCLGTPPICGNGVCENGESYKSCSSDCPAQLVEYHSVCQNNACVQVEGVGTNECVSDVNCIPSGHFSTEREVFFNTWSVNSTKFSDSNYLIRLDWIKSKDYFYQAADIDNVLDDLSFIVDTNGVELAKNLSYFAKIKNVLGSYKLTDIKLAHAPFDNSFYYFEYDFNNWDTNYPWAPLVKSVPQLIYNTTQRVMVRSSAIPDLEYVPQSEREVQTMIPVESKNPVIFTAKLAKGKIDIAVPIFYTTESPDPILVNFFEGKPYQTYQPLPEFSNLRLKDWFEREAIKWGISDLNISLHYYGPYHLADVNLERLRDYDAQYVQEKFIAEFKRLNPTSGEDVMLPFYFEEGSARADFADRQNKTSLISFFAPTRCSKCLETNSVESCKNGYSPVPGGTSITETCLEVIIHGTDPLDCPRDLYPDYLFNTQSALAADWQKCWVFDFESEILTSTSVAAHELGHIFGANDKYTGFACKLPLVDSNYGDLMCGGSLIDIKIGLYSAKEMGWIDLDGDGIKEVYDMCPWNKQNDC